MTSTPKQHRQDLGYNTGLCCCYSGITMDKISEAGKERKLLQNFKERLEHTEVDAKLEKAHADSYKAQI